MKKFCIFITLIFLFSFCQKDVLNNQTITHTQYFSLHDTNWTLLIDKYHADFLPEMECMYMKNCTLIFNNDYDGYYLFLFVRNCNGSETSGIYTGPAIHNDTLILEDPLTSLDMKTFINKEDFSISGLIQIKDIKANIIPCELKEFKGELEIIYKEDH